MKTIDHVKKHLKEWPEGCTYICVDDDGQIWLHNLDQDKARYGNGGWYSRWYDEISTGKPEEKLEDNDKIITKEEYEMECQFTIHTFDEELKALLKKAGQNGINIEYISSNMMNVSTAEKSEYVLIDYNVEYEKRG